jgi:acyl-CoA dehydrogenase
MFSESTSKANPWVARVNRFMVDHVYPNLDTYQRQLREGDKAPWNAPPIAEELKERAKSEGLWNLFMPPSHGAAPADDRFVFEGPGLSNFDYAPLAEIMGRVRWASELFNCSAPDTGNMELLARYGSYEQKKRWLEPLMNGEIRSAFLMTEPQVACSDATNVETKVVRDGSDYVIDGRKWWGSGVGDPRCAFYIVMGKTDPAAKPYRQQSMILVPADAPGVEIVRMLTVFGYDHAPHGHAELRLTGVRVPVENVIVREGAGFEIAQGRLGPGRIHHGMRTVGVAEVALAAMCRRLLDRTTFGRRLADRSLWEQRIGECRTEIEMARLLCLKAAHMMDVAGNKSARAEIAMIKNASTKVAQKVLDYAIQAHGAGGLSEDYGLATLYAHVRSLRFADGPDEVHNRTIAKLELAKYSVEAR